MKLLELLREYRFELIAFTTGASVMMLEIVGARLIAPYLGTSVYVWTAMIGVILGALAAGYWIGGWLADRPYNHRQLLALILAGAAILVLLAWFLQDMVLSGVAGAGMDLRFSALLAGLVLFGPPSLLIGMVMPHLAKIRITNLDTTGQSIGRLEAAGAVGSIAGTFACGYWLLGYIGSESITLAIVIVLIATSFLAQRSMFVWPRVGIAAAALLLIVVPKVESVGVLADVDTSYGRYRVLEGRSQGRVVHSLVTDPFGIQSQMFADDPTQPALKYVQRFMEVYEHAGSPGSVLVVGGGTHTFPTMLAQHADTVDVTVVEIDPTLDELAGEYFAFAPSDRLRVVHADGRTYLNQEQRSYDLIYLDAFSSITPPFQLTTKETVARVAANTAEGGVVAVNVIGSHGGRASDFVGAMKNTFETGFSHVGLYQIAAGVDLRARQNLLLIASNDAAAFAATSNQFGGLEVPPHDHDLVFTDDFAPVERMTQ